MYVAKYCSKGSFEHPLCAKNFFYRHADGTTSEYHSKHYERCLQFYGIDAPLVDLPFRIIPRGLGNGYLTNKQVSYHLAKKDVKRIIDRKHYVFSNGKKIALPEYYYKKIVGNYLRDT